MGIRYLFRESVSLMVSYSWLEFLCFTLLVIVSIVGVNFLQFPSDTLFLPLAAIALSLGLRFRQQAIDVARGRVEFVPLKRSRITQPEILVSLPQFGLKGIVIGTNPGFIYVMRRSDGIYKFGKSDNPYRRLREHTASYGKEFQIVRRFSVPDMKSLESLALQLTSRYQYDERGRDELRKMSEDQLNEFLGRFAEICKEVVDK